MTWAAGAAIVVWGYDQSMGSGISALQRTATTSTPKLGWYYHEDGLTRSMEEFVAARGDPLEGERRKALDATFMKSVMKYFRRSLQPGGVQIHGCLRAEAGTNEATSS